MSGRQEASCARRAWARERGLYCRRSQGCNGSHQTHFWARA